VPLSAWVNWLLIIAGVVCVILELAMGALTGFDLALIGTSLAAGGAIGLFAGSAKVGMFSAGALAFIYIALFRRWLRARLTLRNTPSNVDAIVGKTGIVTKRIAAAEAGRVKVDTEEWRAELAPSEQAERPVGASVRVEAVDGVTLKVR
jgi:membrane protein implicated in regulation of membrane protease activity